MFGVSGDAVLIEANGGLGKDYSDGDNQSFRGCRRGTHAGPSIASALSHITKPVLYAASPVYSSMFWRSNPNGPGA